MTLKSGKVYSDTGAPNNTYGVDGDIYMQLDGLKTTYRKEGAVWVAVGSSLGAIPEFISGSGVPSSLLGADNQYYRNVENQDIYYKSGGLWSAIGNLQGLAFQALLIQHGIGKDLGTAPNLINSGSLNSYITAGEFYFINVVADRPFDYGLMKVWRENSTSIYQLVQGAGSTGLATRYSGDGGATWTGWRYAFSGGLATNSSDGLVRKATQAEMNSGAANVWPDAQTIVNAFVLNVPTNQMSLKLPNGFVLKMGLVIYGELPATAVTTAAAFDTPFVNDCLFAFGVPYNPNVSGQMAFLVTTRGWSNYSVNVEMFELAGSGHQIQAGYIWFAVGY